METRVPSAQKHHAAFLATLERLRRDHGLLGALLVSRDGFTVLNACPGLDDPERFSAMQATALGAAEATLARPASMAKVTIVMDTHGSRFVSRAIDASLIVIAMMPATADGEPIFSWMDELARAAL